MQRSSVVIAVACLAALAMAQAPRFTGPEPILDAGVPIDVGYYGAPLMFDWDLDGAKDLICGQFNYGYVRFYSNFGPDSAPEFSGFQYMQASGSPITLPYG